MLLFLSFIGIVLYNYMNPDETSNFYQIQTFNKDTHLLEKSLIKAQTDLKEGFNQTLTTTLPDTKTIDSDFQDLEDFKKNLKVDLTEQVIDQKSQLDFAYLYNNYSENSWQRFALNEENSSFTFGTKNINYKQDIQKYQKTINSYELDENSSISLEDYNKAVNKYHEYVNALNSDNWKEFVKLKIKNLKELKNESSEIEEDLRNIDFEIDTYQLRLNNNVIYADNILNQYIYEYLSSTYCLQYNQNMSQLENSYIKEIEQNKAKIQLTKYAIENNINQDISPEHFDLIYSKKMDARNSFIRAFEYFDLIIIIIAIYISCVIVTEETNKRTIKSLLTKPHKRSTILVSKILACTITILITVLFVTISQYIVGGILYGFESYSLDYIGYNYNNHQVFTMNLFQFITLVGLTKMPMYFIIITFCILIGILNNNIAMTMILTLITIMLSNSVLSEWSKNASFSNVSRYFITNNWDFSNYLFGQISSINGINLNFSLIIYLIYLLLFLCIAIYKFNKKEINNT